MPSPKKTSNKNSLHKCSPQERARQTPNHNVTKPSLHLGSPSMLHAEEHGFFLPSYHSLSTEHMQRNYAVSRDGPLFVKKRDHGNHEFFFAVQRSCGHFIDLNPALWGQWGGIRSSFVRGVPRDTVSDTPRLLVFVVVVMAATCTENICGRALPQCNIVTPNTPTRALTHSAGSNAQ